MKKYNLLVVAHPDDETIFFGGLVQVYRRKPWKIICVTDGNADGLGEKRKQEFFSACDQLGAKSFAMWDFPDRYASRIDAGQLRERLLEETPAEVFTHGALGEYGHPHHQDVCLGVYRAFQGKAEIWSPAYNTFAEKVHRVPRKAFERKCAILAKTYFGETNRFARWLPAYNHEGFTRLNLKEIEMLYAYFKGETPLVPDQLEHYKWFEPYLEEFRRQISSRPF
jgi:LmbE family N-acetylglucosaminyl deacetylase